MKMKLIGRKMKENGGKREWRIGENDLDVPK